MPQVSFLIDKITTQVRAETKPFAICPPSVCPDNIYNVLLKNAVLKTAGI